MGPLAGDAILMRVRKIEVMIMQKRGEPHQQPKTNTEKHRNKFLSEARGRDFSRTNHDGVFGSEHIA
jgi:hypothetical protein